MDIVSVAHAITGASTPDTSGWDIATAIGTVGAVIVAVGTNAYQRFIDHEKDKNIRRALSPAFRNDVITALTLVRGVVEDAEKVVDVRATNSGDALELLRRIALLSLPAFERFANMLPRYDRRAAPIIVEAYGQILRLVAVTRIIDHRNATYVDLTQAMRALRDNGQKVISKLEQAECMLAEYCGA
jgi:hypothetical protein